MTRFLQRLAPSACALAVAVVALLGATARPAAAEKWALVVGVGASTAPDTISPLFGPHNDVTQVTDLLRGKYGFATSNIRLLEDRDATRAGILAGWDWLIAHAKPGDCVFFFYSGHGVLMPKQTRDAKPGEQDGAICPYGAVSRTQLVYGWEIGQRIDRLHTDNVTVVMDACHSGRSSRGIFSGRTRDVSAASFGVKPTTRPRELPTFSGAPATREHPERYIGASRSDQKAREDIFFQVSSNLSEEEAERKASMGALTYYLVNELRADTTNRLTYAELVRRVRTGLRSRYGDEAQEPQAAGPALETTPFLAERGAPPASTGGRVAIGQVDGVQGSTVTLHALGGTPLVPGSLLTASGTKEWVEVAATPAVPSGGAALLRLTTVNGLTASATLLKGTIASGSTLFEVAHGQGDGRLRVAVAGSGSERITSRLTGLGFVTVVPTDAGADVVLESTASGITPYRGGIALPVVAESALPDLLKRLQAGKLLTELKNPASDALDVTLTVNGAEGYGSVMIKGTADIRISTKEEVYITLVDVAADGSITGLADQSLSAGNEFVSKALVTPPAGLDTVKVIVTRKPLGIMLPGTPEEARKSDPAGLAREIVRRITDSLNNSSKRLAGTGISTPDNAVATGSDWGSAEFLLRIDK